DARGVGDEGRVADLQRDPHSLPSFTADVIDGPRREVTYAPGDRVPVADVVLEGRLPAARPRHPRFRRHLRRTRTGAEADEPRPGLGSEPRRHLVDRGTRQLADRADT